MLRWKLGPGWARSVFRALVRGESTRGVGWGGGDAHKQATDRHRGKEQPEERARQSPKMTDTRRSDRKMDRREIHRRRKETKKKD